MSRFKAIAVAFVLGFAALTPIAVAQADAQKWVVIRTFDNDADEAAQTISVPLSILSSAIKLVPAGLRARLLEEGVDVDEIVRLANEEDITGTIARIEDNRIGQTIVVAIEAGGIN